MEMIEKTKNFEATYLKSLADQLNSDISKPEFITWINSRNASQVKDHLIKMNEFKPNVSFSPDSFGQLRLNEYSSTFIRRRKWMVGR